MIRKKREKSEKVVKSKPLVIIGVVTAMVIGVVGFGMSRFGAGNKKYEGQTLHVYNWGEYTGENILSAFEGKNRV